MVLLGLAVLAFILIHLIPVFPNVKARLKERFGKKYGMGFAIAATLTLILIIVGWRLSPFLAVYEPPTNGRYVTFGLTLLAFLCLSFFIFRGRIRLWLRFPLALGVIFWGTGHLFANGDRASLILFGGMIAYAVLFFVIGLINGVKPEPEVRKGHDLFSIIAGFALYGLFIQLHPLIIGVPVLSLDLLR